jgi:hypothetical protein
LGEEVRAAEEGQLLLGQDLRPSEWEPPAMQEEARAAKEALLPSKKELHPSVYEPPP